MKCFWHRVTGAWACHIVLHTLLSPDIFLVYPWLTSVILGKVDDEKPMEAAVPLQVGRSGGVFAFCLGLPKRLSFRQATPRWAVSKAPAVWPSPPHGAVRWRREAGYRRLGTETFCHPQHHMNTSTKVTSVCCLSFDTCSHLHVNIFVRCSRPTRSSRCQKVFKPRGSWKTQHKIVWNRLK